MTEAGASAVGANCGVGIAEYVPICRRLLSATDLPVWIKANAGLPQVEGGRITYRTAPAQFAAHLPDLLRAGANFVGGCCGTDPEFIRAAAAVLGNT
jgi:methionine synthase I (cobalamin-dependent)